MCTAFSIILKNLNTDPYDLGVCVHCRNFVDQTFLIGAADNGKLLFPDMPQQSAVNWLCIVKTSPTASGKVGSLRHAAVGIRPLSHICLLYTSDAADE